MFFVFFHKINDGYKKVRKRGGSGGGERLAWWQEGVGDLFPEIVFFRITYLFTDDYILVIYIKLMYRIFL